MPRAIHGNLRQRAVHPGTVFLNGTIPGYPVCLAADVGGTALLDTMAEYLKRISDRGIYREAGMNDEQP
jgi:hypothetical protein